MRHQVLKGKAERQREEYSSMVRRCSSNEQMVQVLRQELEATAAARDDAERLFADGEAERSRLAAEVVLLRKQTEQTTKRQEVADSQVRQLKEQLEQGRLTLHSHSLQCQTLGQQLCDDFNAALVAQDKEEQRGSDSGFLVAKVA